MARKIAVVFMMASVSFFLMQTMVFAGGTRPEPGAGCAVSGLKYVPPPFNGTLTLTLDSGGNRIDFSGSLVQVGNPDCVVEIRSYRTFNGVWENLHSVDLRQQCLERDVDFFLIEDPPGACGDLPFEYFESVGVGNLSNTGTVGVKTARIVGMGLN
jgi:hypothetical protein